MFVFWWIACRNLQDNKNEGNNCILFCLGEKRQTETSISEFNFFFIDNYDGTQSCSSTWSWITIRNKFLSGATIISCFLLLTLKNVRSLRGSMSLTTDLAFLASSVTLRAYYLGFESLLVDDIVDLRNLPVSSTIKRPWTPGWLLILAILSSTSAIWLGFLNLLN